MSYPGPLPGAPYPPAPHYYYPASTGSTKPTAAFVLSLLAGIFITLVAIFLVSASFVTSPYGAGAIGFLAIGGLAAFALGMVIIVLSLLVYVRPEHHLGLGLGILLLSLASIVGTGGGFIGLILGVIGGSLAIAHSPAPVSPYFHAYPPWAPPTYYAPVSAWGGGPGTAGPPYSGSPYPGGPYGPVSPAGAAAESSLPHGRPCPRCGGLSPLGARFCSNCGAPSA
ncbi:MAG TPA: zinc ribbon domain-containing protein [Thermoplasmata archaeon]|nr:zinc ribbon domain-containing protein [Thermoplasmata archaeon]